MCVYNKKVFTKNILLKLAILARQKWSTMEIIEMLCKFRNVSNGTRRAL